MKMKLLKITLFWLYCLAISNPLLAQNTASLKGLVQTESGEALNGVSVTATNIASDKTISTTTNEKGIFIITTLEIGSTYHFKWQLAFFNQIQKILNRIRLIINDNCAYVHISNP